MNSQIRFLLEGKIDFEGQKLANRVLHVGLILSTVASFFSGFFAQSLRVTFSIFVVVSLVVAVLTIPQWPIYNKHRLVWLPKLESEGAKKEQ